MTDLCTPIEDFLLAFQCSGTLKLGDFSFNTKAWTTVHLLPLWMPGGSRGTNLVLPGTGGRVAYPKILDEAEYTLPLLLASCWTLDEDGEPVPQTDQMLCLELNLAAMLTGLLPFQDPDDNTFDAELTMPSGALRAGKVQIGSQAGTIVLGEPHEETDGVFYRATLYLTVMDGWLFPTGP